jgi:parvulin-like peptidyl-prolyl isomerase
VRRSVPVLAAVLGAALLLSACGGAASPTAAKVNTTRILRSDLNDQLEVLSNNTKWMAQVAEQFGKKTLAEPNGGVSTSLSAAWLTALMNQAIVDTEFEAKDLKVSDENKQAAKAAANQLFNTQQGQTFGSMPKWFRDDFLAGQERYEAVKEVVPDNPVATDAQIEEFFGRVAQQYCPSGNAISHILQSTREGAEQIEAALAAGQDFVTLARQSEDTATDTAGGFLTCTGSPNFQQLPEPFRQAVEAVPLGGISQPIQSDAGWHVVRVTPFDIPNVRAFIADLYRRSLQPPMTQFINNQLLKAKLWIDPRYGTLLKGPVRVQPPKAPRPRNNPPTTTSTSRPPGS